MSDVLLYAALKENARLLTLMPAAGSGTTPTLEQYCGEKSQSGDWCKSRASGSGSNDDFSGSTAALKAEWAATIGTVTGSQANGFKVCDTSSYFRCGQSCTWCVPPGVSRARFQSWGPGSGTGSNCCCGGAPFGASGAYSVVELDVTPGHCWCLCAGCAYCCFAYQTSHGGCGGSTCICSGNANVCITTCSGDTNGCFCKWNCVAAVNNLEANSTFQMPGCQSDKCGPENCSGWNFCWDSGNDSMCIDFLYDCQRTWAYTPSVLTTYNGTAYGIPSMFPMMQVSQNNLTNAQTYTCPAPVFGYEDCSCAMTYWQQGTSCFGCNFTGCNNRQIPGSGGAAGTVGGGCNSCGGDSGRMGMICVSWVCS